MRSSTTANKPYDLAILISRYLPGFKHGGPITSISNLVSAIGDDYKIAVICLDRDTGMTTPYPNLESGVPQRIGKADVFYVQTKSVWSIAVSLIRLLSDLRPRVVYSNSLFEHRFSILPAILWRFGRLPASGFIVAPRGELARNALNKGHTKKKLVLNAMAKIDLYKYAAVQATSDAEVKQLSHSDIFDADRIVKLPNFVSQGEVVDIPTKSDAGFLKMVFFARITQMKNLVFALELLQDLDPDSVSLDIWGPIDDSEYFEKCQAISARLPPSMKVSFLGPLAPPRQLDILPNYDLLILPTLTENHGHAILESMAAGLPALISTGTPWRGLAELEAGQDVPLSDRLAWLEAIREFAAMDSASKLRWAHGAQRYARKTAQKINQPALFTALYNRSIELAERKA